MAEQVSLRELLDERFHRIDRRLELMDQRLQRIEERLDIHTHKEFPTWAQFIGVLTLVVTIFSIVLPVAAK